MNNCLNPDDRNRKKVCLLLSPKQAAQALAISERTLWQLTKDGEIASIKVRSCVRYPVTGLERYIAEQVEKSA